MESHPLNGVHMDMGEEVAGEVRGLPSMYHDLGDTTVCFEILPVVKVRTQVAMPLFIEIAGGIVATALRIPVQEDIH